LNSLGNLDHSLEIIKNKIKKEVEEEEEDAPPHLTLAKPKSGSLKLSVHTIDII
jgi:hypothetical protein